MTRTSLLVMATALTACSRAPDTPTPTPAPSPSAAAAIPAVYQGRWAITPADCRPRTGADARGLLTIGGAAIAFGLDQMLVDRVIIRPGRLGFDITETQDGVAASRRYEFGVSADQRRLTRVESGLPDQVYTRCPDPTS